jgi:hypothetical protein
MRAKLECEAGTIPEGTEVEIISKTDEADVATVDESLSQANRQLSYRVQDDEGHAEDVDTRDLSMIR